MKVVEEIKQEDPDPEKDKLIHKNNASHRI
jgi:hypothetical protein